MLAPRKLKTFGTLVRRAIAASVALTCLVASSDSITVAIESGTSFPYQAIVLKNDASVRSGPASVHYSTEELPQGATVEVHRHDPGGWCAIRPPRGSFSLIPAATVKVGDDNLARVIDANTQAWVGTRLGAVEKPLWQVKLREDEQVEILGEVSWPHPDGHSTIWYQIAPPAGEFRWIQISDLQLPPGVGLAVALKSPGTKKPPVRTQTTKRSTVQPASLQQLVPDSRASVAAQASGTGLGWRRSTRPIPSDDQVPRNEPASNHFGSHIRTASEHQNVRSAPAPDRYASAQPFANVAPITGLARQRTAHSNATAETSRIEELEYLLTNQMLQPPQTWRVESIMTEANGIYQSNLSPVVQQRAGRLIEKCRKCQQLQAGFAATGAQASGIQSPSSFDSQRSNLTGAGIRGSDALQNVGFGTTYDAHGWLNELVREQGALDSEYVLQDRNGKITHHITAAPGLNLHRYVKSRIGVIGSRGYNHRLKLDHVVASRVIVLDQAR